MSDYISKWHKELGIFSKIKPLIILEGNVLDSYQYPEEGSTPKGSILRLPEYLHFYFKDMGYQNIVFYDSLRGFYNTCEEGYLDNFAKLAECSASQGFVKADFKGCNKDSGASSIVRKALSQNQEATVIVMDFASRYITSPDNMEQSEVDSFTVLLQASLDAKDVRTESNGILKNLLILITNKANDIPAWFYLQNPNVKMITLASPSKEEREALVKSPNFPSFFAGEVYMQDKAYYDEHPDELEKIQDKFVALTDGFSFTEINGLRRLCKNEKIRMADLCDVIDLYKYGIRENPWKQQLNSVQYNLLLQDFVCSVCIRIARDMFALLPINHVIVHAVMNGDTVVSVDFDRTKLSKVKFGYIDPSDTVNTFNCRMSFTENSGFSAVNQLE